MNRLEPLDFSAGEQFGGGIGNIRSSIFPLCNDVAAIVSQPLVKTSVKEREKNRQEHKAEMQVKDLSRRTPGDRNRKGCLW